MATRGHTAGGDEITPAPRTLTCGLIVEAELTRADGRAERRAALDMIHRPSPGSTRRLTPGADKGYDSADFVADLRWALFRAETILRSAS